MTRGDFFDELHLLKQEAARLTGTRADELRNWSAQQARAIDADARKLLLDLHEALKNEEHKLEEGLPDRIAAVLTTAIALGVVIGWALRKRS
jgi:hypothetical protein